MNNFQLKKASRMRLIYIIDQVPKDPGASTDDPHIICRLSWL